VTGQIFLSFKHGSDTFKDVIMVRTPIANYMAFVILWH